MDPSKYTVLEAEGYKFYLPRKFSEFRKDQVPTALRIVEHFQNGVDVVMLQAPPGSGKTLLAEMVRQMLGQRAVYLAPYLQLQDQFLRDFSEEPTFARVIKGRSNYPHGGRYGVRDFPRITCADCRNKSLCGDGVCNYSVAKRHFLRTQIGVANTAYFMAAANHLGMFRPGQPPNPKWPSWSGDYLTVVDECDVLAGVMLGFLNVEITMKRLDEIADLAGMSTPMPPKTNFWKWPAWWMDVREVVEKALEVLEEQGVDDSDMVQVRRLVGIQRLKMSLDQVEVDWIYEPFKAYKNGRRTGDVISVTLEPLVVGELGKTKFWDKTGKVLECSGTIILPEVHAKETGLDVSGKRWVYEEIGSDWDWKRRVVFQVTGCSVTKEYPKWPWQRQPCWPTLLANVLWVLFRHEESTLIHTVSHQLARDLGGELKEILGDRIIIHEGGHWRERDRALEKFKRTPGSVLVTASASRGIDLYGDLCRNVIVAKVPWPNIGDKKVKARMEAEGGWVWFNVQTVRELLQSVMRAMRGPDDWCRIYVVDEQISRILRLHGLIPKWWMKTVLRPGDYYAPTFR